MAHPWRGASSRSSALLLLLGLPFLHLQVGSGDVNALPPEAESRRGDELLREISRARTATASWWWSRYPDGTPLTAERVGGPTISAAGSPRARTWRGWRAWWISIRA